MAGKGGVENILVTSYTFSSMMMYMPFSASLWAATSEREKVLDILESGRVRYGFGFG